MKRFTIFSLTCFLSMGSVFAQQGVTQCGVPTGQPKFPLQAYQELPDPAAPSEKEWAAVTAPQVSWGTIDVRYAKHQLPALKKTTNTSLKGWRGERVNAQAVVWTGTELKDLNFSFTDFKDKKELSFGRCVDSRLCPLRHDGRTEQRRKRCVRLSEVGGL